MLLGEFEHTIDEKNRLTLPAKFRQALSGGLVITRGMDGCLYCYPEAGWQ
jgi:MraZ protein